MQLKKMQPKQAEFYAKLRAEIESGDYAAGSYLPTEDEMCAKYGVTRYSLREVVGVLERQGFVQRRRRLGTCVLTQMATGALRYVAGFRYDLLQLPSGSSIQYKFARKIRVDGSLARTLGCDELREFWHLEGLRSYPAQSKPIARVQIYIDASRTSIAPTADLGNQLNFRWVEQSIGCRLAGATQEISAVSLTEEDARLLADEPGAPALRILRRYFDDQHNLVQIGVSVFPGTRFDYTMRIDFDD